MAAAIAITAHHDDAVLWCGGTILRTIALGWQWTVIALCVPDRQRQGYFKDYCASVGATPVVSGFGDYQDGVAFSRNGRGAMEMSIMLACPNTRFDWAFTHSRNEHCEYGLHANHREVREAARGLVAASKLCPGLDHLAYFSYSPIY